MLLIEPANIFRGAGNDYNIRVMNCKKPYLSIEKFVKDIAGIIKDETGVDPLENTSWRKREYVLSRQLFMVMLYNSKNGKSLEYSSSFVDKDHSTLCHAQKTISDLSFSDKIFKAMYDRIETKVKSIR
jgi:hypothetical protein